MSKYEHVQSSDGSSEYVAARKRSAFHASLGRKEITADINQPLLNGDTLAAMYRACTGRRVIVSAAASTAEFSMVHEASPQHPITNAQVGELIKKSAILEGFAFSPDGGDPNLDILTLRATGVRCIELGVPVFNENVPLPEGDEVITYIMTLKNVKPDEAVAILTKSVGEFGPYGSIAPVPSARAIVVTERTSVIRRLVTLKKELDKP